MRYADGVTIVPGSTEQGAALEPGVTLLGPPSGSGRARLWERAAAVNVWAVGAGLTAYAPDPRFRLNAGFERRWTQPAHARRSTADLTGRSSGWPIVVN